MAENYNLRVELFDLGGPFSVETLYARCPGPRRGDECDLRDLRSRGLPDGLKFTIVDGLRASYEERSN